MATAREITVGTNAAIPAVTAFIDSKVPEMFWEQVNALIPQMVAICVENALPAVDAYRSSTTPKPPAA